MFTETINDVKLVLETADTSFSPNGIDKGTIVMLSAVDFSQQEKVLDLGCGYGVVGIYAAKLIGAQNVVMSDIDAASVELAQHNALLNNTEGIRIVLSDGFTNIQDSNFTLILSNPPYHSDFSVPKGFIEKGFNRLKIGGKMLMVTKRKDWYKNKFIAIFGDVKIIEKEGYFLFCAEKRSTKFANVNQKK